MTGRDKESYSIQSVENALDVLEALCEGDEEVRVSHLSEKLGLHKTSVFRLLATFENRGYVERGKSAGKYRLGLSAYEMGQKLLSRMVLLRKARPIMERLVRQCNEAAYLVVRRHNEVLFLDMVDTTHQVKIIPLTGKRFPLLATAPGRVARAYEFAGEGKGATEAAGDAGELATIRRQGACTERGGLGEGIVCLAVPVFNRTGEVAACLSLVGPDFRMSPERITDAFLAPLREAGEIVSSNLGYLAPYLGKDPF